MSNRPNSAHRTGRTGSSSRTPVWVWAAVGAVVVVALGMALLLANSSSESVGGEVQASGAALGEFTGEGPDTAVGRQAPVVRGTNFAGEPVTIGEPGTPQVLVFLAHWCPVCQEEVPELVAWADAGGDTSGVEVVGIATNIDRTRTNWPPGEWLAEEGWPYQTLVDGPGNRAALAYGLKSYPYFVVLDSSGKVVYRVSGKLSPDAFAALVEAARTGVPPSIDPTGGASTPADGGSGGDVTVTTGAPPAG